MLTFKNEVVPKTYPWTTQKHPWQYHFLVRHTNVEIDADHKNTNLFPSEKPTSVHLLRKARVSDPHRNQEKSSMALQTGFGLSRILFIAGAGYTGTILIKNGKMSDIITELQAMLKGGSKDDSETAMHRLIQEMKQQINSSRQITVINGGGQNGNLTSLIIPAATVGALGYGYMWWKGISFSDLMYVTKRNMASAVTNLTKHLETVSEALAATKRHLTQRIENLDGKMDEQHEISKLIMNNVNNVQDNLGSIEKDLGSLQELVFGLEGKMGSLEAKQNFANAGVWYLCNFVNGKKEKMPEILQDQLQASGRSRSFLTSSDSASLKGLKDIAESLISEDVNTPARDVISQDGIERLDNQPRSLMRTASIKC